VSKLRGQIITVGVGVLAFFGVLLAPGSFFVHPNFVIEVSSLGNSMEKVSIVNDGLIQAKNVRISITSNSDLTINWTDCPEGFTTSNKEKTMAIFEMTRMSTNLACSFEITSNSEISKIVVTADNSPASVKENQEMTKSASLLIDSIQTMIIATIIGILVSVSVGILKKAIT